MQLFIGFTGVKQSGKTTSFNFIKEKYPFVQEIAIAGKLKEVCSEVFCIPRDSFDDPKKKEVELDQPIFLDSENVAELIKGFGFEPDFDKHVRPHMNKVLHTPRYIAQYVGTEVLRNVDFDIHCYGSIHNLPADGTFIVTDMRFPNEYKFFSNKFNKNFYPFYINNISAEIRAGTDTHASEQHILQIAKQCEKIENNKSLDDLRVKVVNVFEEIWKKYQ